MPTTSSTNTPKESDLEKILKCEIKRKPFQSFLEQQFCAENLNFYLAVEEYRKIADEPINARKAKGMEIYERHFITNSAEPVNIDNSTNKTIKDAVLEGGFCHDLYDIAQYQIFHLLKYDCWPRYLRAISTDAKDKESEESGDTHGVSTGDKNKAKSGKKDGDCKGSSLRSGDIEKSDDTGSESPRPLRQTQEVDKFCILLTNEGANSERIALKDPRESVARWIVNTATTHAMDKNCCEVVDAQTGSTIDPARQAVDALHNRSVRLMGVVYVTVEFLSPNVSSKNHQPQPARVVTLKARHSLTVGTALRPLFAKYMIDPTQVAILYYGTCDQVIPRTQLGSIPPRKLSVMTYQQLQERQQMPRKDYQRNDVANSPLLTAKDYAVPFHQHGDVAFYVIPMDAESKHQKHSATRSNSTNPKSDGSLSGGLMTRFRRKASQAVGGKDNEQNHGSTSGASFRANISTQNVSGSSSGPSTSNNNFQNKGEVVKQNSVDKGAKAQVKIAATVTANDIPYCGENNIADEAYYYQKELLTKQVR
uniref:RGS domain-containing protein n=1 Tax=Rhabditophanes sp. KR3021 TaxID=114890 RepID=A0AC35U4U5_9BILA